MHHRTKLIEEKVKTTLEVEKKRGIWLQALPQRKQELDPSLIDPVFPTFHRPAIRPDE